LEVMLEALAERFGITVFLKTLGVCSFEEDLLDSK
jgi:hypothetical protein